MQKHYFQSNLWTHFIQKFECLFFGFDFCFYSTARLPAFELKFQWNLSSITKPMIHLLWLQLPFNLIAFPLTSQAFLTKNALLSCKRSTPIEPKWFELLKAGDYLAMPSFSSRTLFVVPQRFRTGTCWIGRICDCNPPIGGDNLNFEFQRQFAVPNSRVVLSGLHLNVLVHTSRHLNRL